MWSIASGNTGCSPVPSRARWRLDPNCRRAVGELQEAVPAVEQLEITSNLLVRQVTSHVLGQRLDPYNARVGEDAEPGPGIRCQDRY